MPSMPMMIGADDGEDGKSDPMQSAFDSIRQAVDEAERDMMMDRDKEEKGEEEADKPEDLGVESEEE